MAIESFLGDLVVPDELEVFEVTPEFTFHLTGSRAFPLSTSSVLQSDWDFFASDSLRIRQFLEAEGFQIEGRAYDGDPLTTLVYRKYLPRLKTHVDVQLVTNIYLKKEINDAIIYFFPAGLPSFQNVAEKKLFAKRLWRMAVMLKRSVS